MTQRPVDPVSGLPMSSLVSELISDSLDGWDVHTIAKRDAAAGKDVIILSVGDPDFDTPAPITEKAIEALRSGRTHYTPASGIRSLLEAVAAYESRRLKRAVGRDEVVICAGAQNALYAAIRCVVDEGDEVLLMSPPYTMFEGVVKCAGGVPVSVPLAQSRSYALNVDQIASAVTGRTRAILLNSPHNPSGAIISQAETDAIAKICREHNLWLISDEVYADLCFDGLEFVSPSNHPDLTDRTIIVRSLSKSHAMSGWRVGWAVAPKSVRTAMDDLLNHLQYGGPAFIQDAAVVALEQDLPEVAEMKRIYCARRDEACEAFGAIPGIEVIKPSSGLFCIMDTTALNMTSLEIAEQLYAEESVSILPGLAFGEEHTGWMRLAFCQPTEVIREAAVRMARFVDRRRQAHVSAAQ